MRIPQYLLSFYYRTFSLLIFMTNIDHFCFIGLFHRGISQSGTALTSWSLALPGATRNNTAKMAELLGCPVAPTKALVDCLRTKPVQDIITTDVHFMVLFNYLFKQGSKKTSLPQYHTMLDRYLYWMKFNN